MKIAHTRRNKNNTTPPQLFHLNKRTCQIKTARLVPAFTARWRSIRKISSAQMTTNPRKITKTSKTQRKQHPPIIKKMSEPEDSEQKSLYSPARVKICMNAN